MKKRTGFRKSSNQTMKTLQCANNGQSYAPTTQIRSHVFEQFSGCWLPKLSVYRFSKKCDLEKAFNDFEPSCVWCYKKIDSFRSETNPWIDHSFLNWQIDFSHFFFLRRVIYEDKLGVFLSSTWWYFQRRVLSQSSDFSILIEWTFSSFVLSS